MIISNLQNSKRIEALHPLFKQLFDYVKSHDLLHEEPGRITLDGDNLFINNSEPECVAQESQKLEVHHRYIDIHILLEGRERIGWKAIEDCKQLAKAYDEEADFELYADTPTTFVDLLPGQIAVVYPEDPHAPIIGHGKIRKLIAKIKL